MKIETKVITGSSQEKIIEEDKARWKIYLRLKPERGKANERLIELIAEKLDVPKSKVLILKGVTSNKKVIRIL